MPNRDHEHESFLPVSHSHQVQDMGTKTPKRKTWWSRRRMIAWAICFLCMLCSIYLIFFTPQKVKHYTSLTVSAFQPKKPWIYNVTRDSNNYGLSDEECDLAFPDLFHSIHKTMEYIGRPITLQDTMGDAHWGETRAMIYDNQVVTP